MIYGTVSVGTTSILIIPANTARTEIQITNSSDTVVVYIGMDSSVTTATGLPFYENQARGHARGFGTYLGDIWGIVASGSADVRFWETTQ